MEAIRNIRLSIKDVVVTTLQNIPRAGSGSGYNIYTEADLRAGTTPTVPYIYVLDEYTKPTQTTLPMFIVSVENMIYNQFELGNRSGRTFDVYFHIFAASRGERDDIAAYFQENFSSNIPYNDYTTGVGVDWGRGKIQYQPNGMTADNMIVPNSTITEASLYNWTRLSWHGWTQK